MFYNHARFILTMVGIVIGLIEYYLVTIYQISYEKFLWLELTLTFSIGEFIIGSVIQKLSISSHTDYLTGLWNRRYFYLKSDQALYKAKEQKNAIFTVANL